METGTLKKTAFGGYNKKRVHEVLEELSMSYSEKLSALAEEKGQLMDKIVKLEDKIKELEETLGASEQEKNHVANAIVSAEKEAAKILSDASIKAEELIKNTELELSEQHNQLKDMRLSILQAMQVYKDKLDSIAKRMSIDEN